MMHLKYYSIYDTNSLKYKSNINVYSSDIVIKVPDYIDNLRINIIEPINFLYIYVGKELNELYLNNNYNKMLYLTIYFEGYEDDMLSICNFLYNTYIKPIKHLCKDNYIKKSIDELDKLYVRGCRDKLISYHIYGIPFYNYIVNKYSEVNISVNLMLLKQL